MGNVNRTLVMPVGWFKADDHFYYARGVAHVYFEILKVCRVGFKNQLATMHATDIMDEVLHELLIAEKIESLDNPQLQLRWISCQPQGEPECAFERGRTFARHA